MLEAYNDVLAFHRAVDNPIEVTPRIPHKERIYLRARLIHEEVNEELLPLLEMRSSDLVAIADAIADSMYVLIGTALEYGIPLPQIWNIVQATNMAKVDPVTGKVRKREDGKVLKPKGWQPPEPQILECLKDFGYEG